MVVAEELTATDGGSVDDVVVDVTSIKGNLVGTAVFVMVLVLISVVLLELGLGLAVPAVLGLLSTLSADAVGDLCCAAGTATMCRTPTLSSVSPLW